MNWTTKYWDALEQLYWTPKYLGLKSISRSHWQIEGDRVSVPVAMTNANGPLYRRATTARSFATTVRRQEETFNHLFDLTFGILDGALTNRIFCRLLNEDRNDSLKSHGRELGQTLGVDKLYDICQPDGFFTGTDWSIAVELKFDALTSLDQLAKYMLAFALERRSTAHRKPIVLAYIAPRPDDLTAGAFPFPLDKIGADQLPTILGGAKSSVLKRLDPVMDLLPDLLDDLRVVAFSWSVFLGTLEQVQADLPMETAEGRTVRRLLGGLADEIRHHPLARLE